MTITPAPLTVTADDKEMSVGDPVPALTSTLSGLVAGDAPSVVTGVADLTTTATSASPAGTYPIVAVLGTLGADNYTFSFLNGTLTALMTAPPDVCYIGTTAPHVWARQHWTTNADGTITIRTTFSKTFVDNTYGANQVGWPGGNHKFNSLVGSDKLEMALFDADGAKQLEFVLDYLDSSNVVPSGYQSSGVTSMSVGSIADVVSASTSIDANFNQFGYVLTSDSPATDAAYTPNPAAPFFIFEAWYEVTVRSEAFGAAGFGYPRVESMHASPSKTGNHTEPLTVVDCSVPRESATTTAAAGPERQEREEPEECEE